MKAVERGGGRTGSGEKGRLGKAENLKIETLNAGRAIANSSQTGKAANRLDEVKGRMLRWTPGLGRIERFHGDSHSARA